MKEKDEKLAKEDMRTKSRNSSVLFLNACRRFGGEKIFVESEKKKLVKKDANTGAPLLRNKKYAN